MSAFLAVDWGTTNRRVYRIEDGQVAVTERDDRGVKAMANGGDYAADVAAMRDKYGDLPMLLAGMVGSTIGWADAGYVRVPAGLDSLARKLHRIDDRTFIIPGVAVDDPAAPDVMRGEEVQLLGAVAAGMTPADALLCQPGTHCKWVEMVGGAIDRFATAMTGELFAMLKGGSVLAAQLAGPVSDGAAFAEGVLRGAKGDLASALFGVRAASVLGHRSNEDSASYASGLLLGSDAAARHVEGRDVYVLADPVLGGLYARTIGILGGRASIVDSQSAFVAGITRIAALRLR